MSENVSEAKQALRALVQANRSNELSSQTKDQFAHALMRLSEGQKRIGCYLSFGSEPDTNTFISYAKAAGLEIVCPRLQPDGQMVMAVLDSETKPSKLGFREPTGPVVAAEDLEMIIVPALAIDFNGKRLGRGAGYFDRYLENYSGPTVGLVYDLEFLPTVPNLPHDKPVSQVVTQTRSIRIGFQQ